MGILTWHGLCEMFYQLIHGCALGFVVWLVESGSSTLWGRLSSQETKVVVDGYYGVWAFINRKRKVVPMCRPRCNQEQSQTGSSMTTNYPELRS